MNNVVRVALQALAATLGGTQSLHTNGFDEALALPTEESATLALRTQQVLGAESGITRTADPLGGSYYVEALTDEVERLARESLERIAEQGGAARAIDYMQEEIHRAAYRFQMEIESGERSVVGVNVHVQPEVSARQGQPDYSALETTQRSRLAAWKASRGDEASAALAEVRSVAAGTGNLLPAFVDAVKVGVTLGEISHALRAEWGTYDG
jgi:methylmalonyl-CoA mutase N-terminal domain/subunit